MEEPVSETLGEPLIFAGRAVAMDKAEVAAGGGKFDVDCAGILAGDGTGGDAGVVFGGEKEGGNGDVRENFIGAGGLPIFLDVFEAVEGCGDEGIEFINGPALFQFLGAVKAGVLF